MDGLEPAVVGHARCRAIVGGHVCAVASCGAESLLAAGAGAGIAYPSRPAGFRS
jgi:hypothetical protein